MTSLPDEVLAIRVTAMPKDTNAHGTIFGGFILSLVDQAGAIAAQAAGAGRVVTVAMHEIVFRAPVFVGDVVTCYARATKRGRTSITTTVRITAASPAQQSRGDAARDVTQAEVVYVQVDERGNPLPLAAQM